MNKIMQPVATTLWGNLALVTLSKDLNAPLLYIYGTENN